MLKKIFIVIGIVLGSVGVFTGAVLGIMAAMGKFETPVVYPDKISLPERVEIVKDEDIHSFVVSGAKNDNETVTKTDCELEIISGGQYITLCDANGEALKTSETDYRKYPIKCNQTIYYKLKTIDENRSQNCSVVLRAYSSYAEHPLTSNDFRIDIDVPVVYSGIKDPSQNVSTENDNYTQNIVIPFRTSRDVTFSTYPSLSIRPFTSKENKEVEIYLDLDGEYLKVTKANIDTSNKIIDRNNNFKLRDVFSYENGMLRFNAPGVGVSYDCLLITFKTYKDKEIFDSSYPNATVLDKIRYDGVTVTKVNISTIGSKVTEVTSRDNFTFNLYKENYLCLDDSITEYNGQPVINLGLQMFDQNGQSIKYYFSSVEVADGIKDGIGAWISIVTQSITQTGVSYTRANEFIFEKVAGEPYLFRIIPTDKTSVGKNYYFEITVNSRGEDDEMVSTERVQPYPSLYVEVLSNDVSNLFDSESVEFDVSYNGTKWQTNDTIDVFGNQSIFGDKFESSFDEFLLVTTEENVFKTAGSITLAGKTYYFIGSIENGTFKNVVEIKDPTALIADKNIYLMQLELGYDTTNRSSKTIDNYVKTVIVYGAQTKVIDLAETEVHKVNNKYCYENKPITVMANFKCQSDYTVAENTKYTSFVGKTDETIVWKYPEFISILKQKYNLSESNLVLKTKGGTNPTDVTDFLTDSNTLQYNSTAVGEAELYLTLSGQEYKICDIEVKDPFVDKLALTSLGDGVFATSTESGIDPSELTIVLNGEHFEDDLKYTAIAGDEGAIKTAIKGTYNEENYGYSCEAYDFAVASNNTAIYNEGARAVGNATLKIRLKLTESLYRDYYLNIIVDNSKYDLTNSVQDKVETADSFTLSKANGYAFVYHDTTATSYAFTAANSTLVLGDNTDYIDTILTEAKDGCAIGTRCLVSTDGAVLAKITDETDGYKFTRISRKKQQLNIKLKFNTKAGETSWFTLIFTSDDRVELNTADWWDDQDILDYKELVNGTNVLLLTGVKNDNLSASHSLIKYVYSTAMPTLQVAIYRNNLANWELVATISEGEYYTFTNSGTYKFEIFADGEKAAIYSGFKVVDNVVAQNKPALTNGEYEFKNNQSMIKYNGANYTLTHANDDGLGAIYEWDKTGTDPNNYLLYTDSKVYVYSYLIGNSSTGILSYFKLSKFDTSIDYGAQPGGYKASSQPSVDITAVSGVPSDLLITSEDFESQIVSGNFTAPHIESVNVAEVVNVITLKDSAGRTLNQLKVAIKNPYTISLSDQIISGTETVLTINSTLAAENPVSVLFDNNEDYQFTYADGKLTLMTFVAEKITGNLHIQATLSDGNTITQDMEVTLNPYTYKEKAGTIYSGVNIEDLIDKLYYIPVVDAYVDSMVLTSLVGGGRTYGLQPITPHQNITLYGFEGETSEFTATFTVRYKEGQTGDILSAVVERIFTVTNPQDITLQYPFDDNDFKISDNQPVSVGGISYHDKFEPVSLSTVGTTTIDFGGDNFVTRVSVNTLSESGYTGAKTFTLSILGVDGIDANIIQINGTKLILPAVNVNFKGAYVLVKITSTSGRSENYMLRLFKGEERLDITTSSKASSESTKYVDKLTDSLPTHWKNQDVSFYLFSSQTLMPDCTYEQAFPTGLDDNKKYKKFADETLPSSIDKYYTLTFGVYYAGGYPIGTISLILQPGSAPSDNKYIINATDNGEYAYTIQCNADAVQTVVPYPFNTAQKSKVYIGGKEVTDLSDYGITFDEASATRAFTLTKYYNYDTDFVVTFTDGGKVFKVTYFRPKFYTNDIQSVVTVGELKDGLGVKEFDNKFDLHEFLHKYNFIIDGDSKDTILENGENLRVASFDNTDKILSFEQEAVEQTVVLKFTFKNWFTEDVDEDEQPKNVTKEITFKVKPDYAVIRTGSGNEATPLISIATEDYTNVNNGGSTITIIKGGEASAPYTWNIGGVTIYSAESRKLNVAILNNGFGNYVLTGFTQTNPTTNEVEAIDYDTNILIKLAHNKNTNTTVVLKLSLVGVDMDALIYIKPVKTYDDLVITYPSGANSEGAYENYTSGWTNTDIHNWLFTNSDGTPRVQVKNSAEIYSATGIGASDKNNPNYLEFVSRDNVVYTDNFETNKLEVVLSNETDTILTTSLTFKQYGDTSNQVYNIHIMPSVVFNDGLDVTTGGGSYEYVYYHSTDLDTALIGVTEYISDVNSISYSGKMYQNSNDRFISTADSTGYIIRKIKYISYINNQDPGDKIILNLGKLKDTHNFDVLRDSQFTFGKVTNTDVDISAGYYTASLAIEKETNNLILTVSKLSTASWRDLKITTSVKGTSGDILNNVPIVLFFEDLQVSAQDVYGGNGFNPLFNTTTNLDARDQGYSLTYLTGSYSQSNKYENLPSSNAIFTFNANSTISTEAVGTDAQVSISALLKKSGFIVATKQFNFKVKVNFQLVTNNVNPDSNTLPVKNQIISYQLSSNSSVINNENILLKEATNDADISIQLKNIYSASGVKWGNTVDLLQEFKNGSIIIECENELFGKNVVKSISVLGESPNETLNIVFNLDYTGDIRLKFTVKTTNEDFVDYITIHCTGNITQDKYDKVITNNGLPFASGSDITLVVGQANKEKGIWMTDSNNIGGDWIVDYCIVPATAGLTAYEMYNSNTEINLSGCDPTSSMKLASVPNDNYPYYVVYHIQHKYLDLKELDESSGPYVTEYFIAYYTKNDTKLTIEHSEWDITGSGNEIELKVFETYDNSGADGVFSHDIIEGEFLSFVQGIDCIRLANVDAKYLDLTHSGGLDSSKAKITSLNNGKYNIDIYNLSLSGDYYVVDLTDAFGNLRIMIINELVCDLQIVSSEQVLYSCNGFKLVTSNNISPKTGTPKPIAELFGYGEIADPKYYTESVIGVYDFTIKDDLLFLTDAISVESVAPVSSITPYGTTVEYKLYAVEYKKTGGTIYNLDEVFYFIKADEIYYADYWKGATPGQFTYEYDTAAVDNQSITYTYYKLSSVSDSGDADFGKLKYETQNKTITISNQNIIDYKTANPNTKYYTVEDWAVEGKLVVKIAIDITNLVVS